MKAATLQATAGANLTSEDKKVFENHDAHDY